MTFDGGALPVVGPICGLRGGPDPRRGGADLEGGHFSELDLCLFVPAVLV